MNATPERIKLSKVGDTVTLSVIRCALASAGQYPGVEFTGYDGKRLVVLEVPEKSADRQLGRIPLTREECVGLALTFSRSPNSSVPAKPFWDISLAQGNGKPPIAVDPHENEPHPADRERERERLAAERAKLPSYADAEADVAREKEQTAKDIYISITKHTLAHVVPLYVEAKIPIDMQAVAAIVATRFIASQRNGH